MTALDEVTLAAVSIEGTNILITHHKQGGVFGDTISHFAIDSRYEHWEPQNKLASEEASYAGCQPSCFFNRLSERLALRPAF